ncbi:MAG: 4Fe-4S dicluster domain-containing protein [Deltaproteobacteria bacterium]|nr:4Fe-4S dicluster domain-containing protein [Deltaproteobacteria bacterium]
MYIPKIDPEKCNLCGECVDVCPADVLEVDDQETRVALPADCLGCESCVAVCPEEAITVEEI